MSIFPTPCGANEPFGAGQFQPRPLPQTVQRVHVGELGARWQFPSDHLPVGATVDGIRIASWNVLNRAYLNHFAPHGRNDQGLANSCLWDEQHRPSLRDTRLSLREERIVDMVKSLASSRDIILLQECSQPFLAALAEALPSRVQCRHGSTASPENDIALLYDQGRLTLDTELSEFVADAYPCKRDRALMSLAFHHQGRTLRVVHSHVPGMPSGEGLREFTEHVVRLASGQAPMVVTGDLNFELAELAAAFKIQGLPPPVSAVNVRSTVGTDRFAKLIDHIVVLGAACSPVMQPEAPETILAACLEASRLLGNSGIASAD